MTGNQCGLVVQAHKRYCAIHQRQQFATAASPERDDDVVHAEDIIQPQNLSGSCMYYVYTAAGKRRHSADGFYEWRHHNRKIMLYNEEKELVADDFVQEPRVGGELNVGQWKVSVESLDRNPLSPNLVQPKHIQRTRLDLSQAIKTRFPRFKEVLAKREEEVRRADQAVITAHNRRDQAASKMERAVFLAEHTDTTITELEQLQERMAVLKQVQVQQQEEFVLIIEEDDGEDYNDDRIDEHVQNEGYRNVATRTQYQYASTSSIILITTNILKAYSTRAILVRARISQRDLNHV